MESFVFKGNEAGLRYSDAECVGLFVYIREPRIECDW